MYKISGRTHDAHTYFLNQNGQWVTNPDHAGQFRLADAERFLHEIIQRNHYLSNSDRIEPTLITKGRS